MKTFGEILLTLGFLMAGIVVCAAGLIAKTLGFIGEQTVLLFNDYPIIATLTAVSLIFLAVLSLTAQTMGY